jgi:hypothetical protein
MSVPLHFVQGPVSRETDIERDVVLPPIDDYYKWGYEQAAHIRAGRFDLVDILNVADEIENVAKNELRSMRSNVEVILLHLLKWEFQPSKRSKSWSHSIGEHRERVLVDLADSATMASKWDETVAKAYRPARLRAAREAKLDVRLLPLECPFSREQVMQTPFDIDKD